MMNWMRNIALYGALVALLCVAGCSSCTDTEGLTDGEDGDAGGEFDIGDEQDADGDSGGDPDDAGDNQPLDCDAANRCGSECCSGDELCIDESCVVAGDECYHSNQCPDDHFCETTLGKCLPDEAGGCFFIPDDDSFDPVVEVAWRAEPDSPDIPMPQYNQVMMAPSVVDITENGIPDIVFSTFQGSDYNGPSVLRAVNGRTFEPVFDLTEGHKMVAGSSSVAIGDIDGDGRNEIVAAAPNAGGLIAFDDHTTGWEVMWTTDAFNMNWDGAYLADLDANGSVEVVASNRVFDGASGDLLCVNDDVGQRQNSLAADLTGDGNLEIVGARGAFRFARNPDGSVDCPTMYTYEGPRGFPAVGDFGDFSGEDPLFGEFDGRPEIAVVSVSATETISLYNGQTGERIWVEAMPTADHPHFSQQECLEKSGGGPPTIADFTGDGMPEIATAGACYYTVYEADGELLWKMATQDQSSRVTGSSVFDFQGNGRAEVVYADECFLRVYDGAGNADGTSDVLFKVANTTGTTRELPVIVDVDGDFHADIVLIGNDYSSGITSRCTNDWEGFVELGGPSRGIRVIRDSENRWVSTRPVWNQHAYSVTNVCDGFDDSLCPGVTNRPGAIPSGRVSNWDVNHLNNYRQNVQGEGLFLAPDLVISDIEGVCGVDGMTLEITVANEGSRSVIEGLNVAVFAVIDGVEELITVLQTTQLLPPGGKETLIYEWEDAPFELGDGEEPEIIARANDDGTGQRQYRECNETNNETVEVISCRCQEDADCAHLTGYYCLTTSGVCTLVDG